MIAACPKCSTRYRVENDRLRPEGVRLRCSRCQSVFRVKPPENEAAAPAEPTVEAQPTPMPRPLDRERLVLIADPDVEASKATAAAIAGWGLHPLLVHDGVEAILAVQRSLPRVVVLDGALPKMFGFQVCELMKRNEQLRDIHVVLIGAIHHRDRYHRAPNELYGADAYLETPDLPHGLLPILRGLGLPVPEPQPAATPSFVPPPAVEAAAPTFEPAPPAVAPRPAPASAPIAAAAPVIAPIAAPVAPSAPAVAPAPDAATADEIAKAERLARIIVSDVVLYNEAKFAAAVAAGNVGQAMDADLEEGRALFRQRIDAGVREMRDFLGDELLRVARSRGMQ